MCHPQIMLGVREPQLWRMLIIVTFYLWWLSSCDIPVSSDEAINPNPWWLVWSSRASAAKTYYQYTVCTVCILYVLLFCVYYTENSNTWRCTRKLKQLAWFNIYVSSQSIVTYFEISTLHVYSPWIVGSQEILLQLDFVVWAYQTDVSYC